MHFISLFSSENKVTKLFFHHSNTGLRIYFTLLAKDYDLNKKSDKSLHFQVLILELQYPSAY